MTLTEYPDVEQRSDEWHILRNGTVTASVVGKLITINQPGALDYSCQGCGAKAGDPCISLTRKAPTPIKTFHDERHRIAGREAATAKPLLEVADNDTSATVTRTLVAERITGWSEGMATTYDMQRGIDFEPYARDHYSGLYEQATEYGYMVREEDGWSLGLSPDGVIRDVGLLEVKCPRAQTHVKTILADEVPGHYMPQLQAALLVSGRQWIDFVSFVSGMPLYVKRVYPDPTWHAAIEAACRAFEQNAISLVADYRKRVADMPTTQRIVFDAEIEIPA